MLRYQLLSVATAKRRFTFDETLFIPISALEARVIYCANGWRGGRLKKIPAIGEPLQQVNYAIICDDGDAIFTELFTHPVRCPDLYLSGSRLMRLPGFHTIFKLEDLAFLVGAKGKKLGKAIQFIA